MVEEKKAKKKQELNTTITIDNKDYRLNFDIGALEVLQEELEVAGIHEVIQKMSVGGARGNLKVIRLCLYAGLLHDKIPMQRIRDLLKDITKVENHKPSLRQIMEAIADELNKIIPKLTKSIKEKN